jgi:uncharacterized membrane protein YfcA
MMEVIILVLAGLSAGIINSVAGGGNLLVFPAFLALGLSPFVAAVTATLVVMPASYASAYGYRQDLRRVPAKYFWLLVPSLLGGSVGIFLLYHTPRELFAKLVPWLVLIAVGLYVFQPQLHQHLRKPAQARLGSPLMLVAVGLFLACIYGGYFGVGVGFLVLVLLSFTNLRSIYQMTGLKAVMIGTVSLLTIITFALNDELAWKYGLLAAAGSIVGGYLGARWAHRISPQLVRLVITIVGSVVVGATFMQAYL